MAFFMVVAVACKYDDGELWDKVNSLDNRLTSIEAKLSQMNSDINSLSTIVNALQNNVYVANVVEVENGYQITFTDGKKITITNGKDGADAPIISVEEFEGKYYWVQILGGTKSWLTDKNGAKIPVTGDDGITPIMKVNAEGYWVISYDRGITFELLLDETNNPVKAVGKDGANGDSYFSGVRVENGELVLVLADGTELRLLLEKNDAINTLLLLTEVNENGDIAVLEDERNYALFSNINNEQSMSLGCFDDGTALIVTNQGFPSLIKSDNGVKINVTYRADKAFLLYNFNGQILTDTLTINNSVPVRTITRSQDVKYDALVEFIEKTIERIMERGLEETFGNIIKPIYKLLQYQRATIDMDYNEELNYQLEQMRFYDWLMRPEYEKLQEMFKIELENLGVKMEDTKKEISEAPLIIIGLLTGDVPYVYSESAICMVDGYLSANANDGEFQFDYGICYAEHENPTIADNVVSKNVTSGFINSITLSLPEKFILSNLNKSTTYYYRAFYKDENGVSYCEYTKKFTTSDIPASITSFVQANSYHSKEGYVYEDNKYHYKYLASVKAEITSFDNISDWGYYYINENGQRVAYSLMSRNDISCDDILTVYKNLDKTSVNIGCYVKYASDANVAVYGDPKEYKLKYNDQLQLAFTDCNYIEITHDMSLGYYRCGLTFDVSFKVQGSENLTSIIIMPFGNFLSWNCKVYSNPSDGDFKTTITDQYLYEYGLHGNFYCFLLAKDVDGNEYYSDNIVRLYHDGYHFTGCKVESYESLLTNSYLTTRTLPKMH